AAYFYFGGPRRTEGQVTVMPPDHTYGSPIQVQYFCGQCHAYPPPDAFPRAAWKEEIDQAYEFFADSPLSRSMKPPPVDHVLHHYEAPAPLTLPLPVIKKAAGPLPWLSQQAKHSFRVENGIPAVSNVNLVHLFDERRLDVLVCDMRAGVVAALRPYTPS